jgi:hypothetical protein
MGIGTARRSVLSGDVPGQLSRFDIWDNQRQAPAAETKAARRFRVDIGSPLLDRIRAGDIAAEQPNIRWLCNNRTVHCSDTAELAQTSHGARAKRACKKVSGEAGKLAGGLPGANQRASPA